jgi:monovalent cation/hydrogen antiporter
VTDDLFGYAIAGVISLSLSVFFRQRGWGIALPLIFVGAIMGLLPIGPDAPPNPEVVLILILAPLVFGEALGSSYLDLRKVSRPVLALAIGLVLTTTAVVGGLVSLVVAFPLAIALALGAILAPTDAVAVSTIAKRASIPRRLVSILEGESLVNDGTGLTALRVAVIAAVAGSVTLVDAAGLFVVAVGVGVAVGALAGIIMSWVLRHSRDLVAANSLIVVAPFLIYLLAERIEGSGILAIVVAALWVASSQHSDPGWSGRLQGTTVWRHLTFILQTFAFFLVGLELPVVLQRLDSDEFRLVAILVPLVLVALIVSRGLFVAAMVGIQRTRERRAKNESIRQANLGKESVIVAWAGARGPVSGLAAFSLPLVTVSGEAFPYRDVLLATTFVIIVLSLLLSLTVGPLANRLGVTGDDDETLVRDLDAALARAAFDRLNDAIDEADRDGNPFPAPIVDRLQNDVRIRIERNQPGQEAVASQDLVTQRLFQLARAMVQAEQEELLRLRDEEGLPDAIVRAKLRDLDVRIQALGTGH